MKEWRAFSDRVEEVVEDSDTPRVIAVAPSSAYVPNVALGAAQVAANMKLMADAPELRAACEAGSRRLKQVAVVANHIPRKYAAMIHKALEGWDDIDDALARARAEEVVKA